MSKKCASSNAIYSRLPDALRYFHSMHRDSLASMVAQCEKAAADLAPAAPAAASGESAAAPAAPAPVAAASASIYPIHCLALELSQFCSHLDLHHRIEDSDMFPRFAKKMDISHLEEQHHQLEAALNEATLHARGMKKLEEPARWDAARTKKVLLELQALVLKHEAAEEAIVSTENIKKYFTKEEAAALMR